MPEITEDDSRNEAGPVVQTLIDNEGRTEPAFRSVNQVVAWNMARLREARGWKQVELAEKLTEIKAEKWTAATVGAAERSWSTERVRRFDANDLAALAHIFDVTLTELLGPPGEDEAPNRYVASETVKGGGTPGTDEWTKMGWSAGDLVSELFGQAPKPAKPARPKTVKERLEEMLISEIVSEVANASLSEKVKALAELERVGGVNPFSIFGRSR
jgi:transcriptional regulator with XRE-family HTH domain